MAAGDTVRTNGSAGATSAVAFRLFLPTFWTQLRSSSVTDHLRIVIKHDQESEKKLSRTVLSLEIFVSYLLATWLNERLSIEAE
jgi:hypothetical protein